MTNQIETREGKEYWDKICYIPNYGFIHSPDNTQVLKVEGIGNWIDKHATQEVVDQAQDKINELTSEIKRLQNQYRWIPFDEQIPEYGTKVLILFKNGHVEDTEIHFDDEGDWHYVLFDGESLTINPTHWMLFPEQAGE